MVDRALNILTAGFIGGGIFLLGLMLILGVLFAIINNVFMHESKHGQIKRVAITVVGTITVAWILDAALMLLFAGIKLMV